MILKSMLLRGCACIPSKLVYASFLDTSFRDGRIKSHVRTSVQSGDCRSLFGNNWVSECNVIWFPRHAGASCRTGEELTVQQRPGSTTLVRRDPVNFTLHALNNRHIIGCRYTGDYYYLLLLLLVFLERHISRATPFVGAYTHHNKRYRSLQKVNHG